MNLQQKSSVSQEGDYFLEKTVPINENYDTHNDNR